MKRSAMGGYGPIYDVLIQSFVEEGTMRKVERYGMRPWPWESLFNAQLTDPDMACRSSISPTRSSISIVKLLDWGEEGHRSDAEIASLRAAFTQEVTVWHKLDHPNVTKEKKAGI
ncbi:uncharacterized protein [Euphorbia lathyris]|uniref:uncharacterized protein isoform X2 n=1 Tax=Euphorbia lathyris TaxID=212925 RepID=UPI003314464F